MGLLRLAAHIWSALRLRSLAGGDGAYLHDEDWRWEMEQEAAAAWGSGAGLGRRLLGEWSENSAQASHVQANWLAREGSEQRRERSGPLSLLGLVCAWGAAERALPLREHRAGAVCGQHVGAHARPAEHGHAGSGGAEEERERR